MAGPRDDDVVDPLARVARVLAGEDPDRRPPGGLRAPRGRRHHLAEATADDRAAALGQEPADRFGPLLVLDAAPDHRYLHRGPASLAGR